MAPGGPVAASGLCSLLSGALATLPRSAGVTLSCPSLPPLGTAGHHTACGPRFASRGGRRAAARLLDLWLLPLRLLFGQLLGALGASDVGDLEGARLLEDRHRLPGLGRGDVHER